ncbi:winged helix DNA-binding protein [Mediterraneibacter glycyrrhizinilyticus]|uniref:MarR family winged helix-turn-helix transcriptional regulator n=1 Tax=Mediterraneibacter glycyrrhizinilyticus TaxID=342942 RepID=UPI0019603BA4|nr:winged helix DNA-binding protein [Mediterraneibacter glycyrrhizinilyticus]MBM6750462.1 winged helix DNA-binding protein [Mediterraneibacter glycyrrhizinilyticus]HJC90662.1 winged helix DNA-binding protein [Candidatus Mediterraneibacter excrementigallinarum]
MNYSLDTLLYGMQFRRLMEKEMQPIETEYGLYKIDVQILLYLKHAGAQNTSKDIMRMNMFTRGHISQSLSRLQKKGYVRMEQDLEDRRCTHNYLTESASDALSKIERMSKQIRKIVLEGVTEEEQKVFATVAQKMTRNIEKVL